MATKIRASVISLEEYERRQHLEPGSRAARHQAELDASYARPSSAWCVCCADPAVFLDYAATCRQGLDSQKALVRARREVARLERLVKAPKLHRSAREEQP